MSSVFVNCRQQIKLLFSLSARTNSPSGKHLQCCMRFSLRADRIDITRRYPLGIIDSKSDKSTWLMACMEVYRHRFWISYYQIYNIIKSNRFVLAQTNKIFALEGAIIKCMVWSSPDWPDMQLGLTTNWIHVYISDVWQLALGWLQFRSLQPGLNTVYNVRPNDQSPI
jgi:hypothetical protein